MIDAGALFALACLLYTKWCGGRTPVLIVWWVVLSFVVEVLGGLILLTGYNNILLYDLFWPVEFILLMVIARELGHLKARLLSVIIVLFLVLWGIDFWNAWGQDRFVTYSFIAGAFLLAGLYLFLLWKVVNTWPGRLLAATPFWLCLAVVVYYGGAAPLLGSMNYFFNTDMHIAQQLYWGIRTLCVIKYVLMGLACLQLRTSTTVALHEPTV